MLQAGRLRVPISMRLLNSFNLSNPYHTSIQHPVECAIEVTINKIYATFFYYYLSLEDVLFIATCFG
jgi:hypothetical protein